MYLMGVVNMSGSGGHLAAGTQDNGLSTAASMLDIGQDGTLGPASVVTMSSPYNQIVAEGNLTLGGSLVVSTIPLCKAPRIPSYSRLQRPIRPSATGRLDWDGRARSMDRSAALR